MIASEVTMETAAEGLPPVAEEVEHPADLSAILEDRVNVCIWRRAAPKEAIGYAERVLAPRNLDRVVSCKDPGRGAAALLEGLEPRGQDPWVQDLCWLAQLYMDLTGASELGLRLHASGSAMCPGFHVDRVGLRLVCTYHGAATEWLPEPAVDRQAIARRDVQNAWRGGPVRRLTPGVVGLLKGESWPGNEGRGAVHRSPTPAPGERRVLLTIDGW
jgi:hypothetical protein